MGGLAFKIWTSEQYEGCNQVASAIPKIGPLMIAEECPEELRLEEKPRMQLTLNGCNVEATGKVWPLEEFMKQTLGFEKAHTMMFATHATQEEAYAKVDDMMALCATYGWECDLM